MKSPHARPRQRGMVLVTALLMLVVVTLLAVSMFRSFGLDERIAGNVREKQRALSAAETAEQFAEQWLGNGNAATPIACVAPLVSSTVGQVCNAVPADVTAVPYTVGVNYSYVPMNFTGMSTTAGTANSYYKTPAYYITWLGTTSTSTMYQIDAVGYGGSADTAAVVEATYAISANTQCKSCGQ